MDKLPLDQKIEIDQIWSRGLTKKRLKGRQQYCRRLLGKPSVFTVSYNVKYRDMGYNVLDLLWILGNALDSAPERSQSLTESEQAAIKTHLKQLGEILNWDFFEKIPGPTYEIHRPVPSIDARDFRALETAVDETLEYVADSDYDSEDAKRFALNKARSVIFEAVEEAVASERESYRFAKDEYEKARKQISGLQTRIQGYEEEFGAPENGGWKSYATLQKKNERLSKND